MIISPAGAWSSIERKTNGLVCGRDILSTASFPGSFLLKRSRCLAINGTRVLASRPHHKTYKIVVLARDGGEILWDRPFYSLGDAVSAWISTLNIDDWQPGSSFPSSVIQGELEYQFKTVETFNTTPGGGTWTVPIGVNNTDYLNVGGGAGGNSNVGGGGGGGGVLTGNLITTPGAVLTVTIGAGGAAANPGNDTVFDTITAGGGGTGGTYSAPTGANGRATGGNGGGGAGGATDGAGGAGNGPGFAGGVGKSNGVSSGGGGGAGQAGVSATASVSGNGGNGILSSISGSSVGYGGGGGGGANPGVTGGLGAATYGGADGGIGTSVVGSNGTANRGGGGGGGGGNSAAGGTGGSGVLILSYDFIYRQRTQIRNLIDQRYGIN